MQGRGVPYNLRSFSEPQAGIYAVSVGFGIGDYKQNIILFSDYLLSMGCVPSLALMCW